MTDREYQLLAASMAPGSRCLRNCLRAFWTGGLICVLGQLLLTGFGALGLGKEAAALWVSLSLIFLSAILTGFSVYDDIAKYAGAGTLVPVTGFANAIAAPCVEYRTEGLIAGVGGKMFTIAGPVLVYGTGASVVYGLIYWLFKTGGA